MSGLIVLAALAVGLFPAREAVTCRAGSRLRSVTAGTRSPRRSSGRTLCGSSGSPPPAIRRVTERGVLPAVPAAHPRRVVGRRRSSVARGPARSPTCASSDRCSCSTTSPRASSLEAVARKAIVYLAIFPTAFFFFAPYSESLFLLLTLIAFREARRDRWGVAAVAGRARRPDPERGDRPGAGTDRHGVRAATRARLPVAEAGGRVGGAPGATRLSRVVGRGACRRVRADPRPGELAARTPPSRPPRSGTPSGWRSAIGTPDPSYWIIDVLVVGVAVVAVIAGARRLPTPYSVYALGSLLIPLSYPFPPRPLLSMPRFVAVIFPVSGSSRTPSNGTGSRTRRSSPRSPEASACSRCCSRTGGTSSEQATRDRLGWCEPRLGRGRRTGHDQGSHRRRPLVGAPRTPPVSGHGGRDRGRGRSIGRPRTADVDRGARSGHRARGHPDAGDGRPRGRPRDPRPLPQGRA